MLLVGVDFLQWSGTNFDMSVIRIEVSISADVADAAERKLICLKTCREGQWSIKALTCSLE